MKKLTLKMQDAQGKSQISQLDTKKKKTKDIIVFISTSIGDNFLSYEPVTPA